MAGAPSQTHSDPAESAQPLEVPLPEGFALPDWNEPVDVAAHFDSCPEHATAKGLFLQAMRDAVEHAGQSFSFTDKIILFKDYPMRVMLEAVLETAEKCFGDLEQRDGIRHVTRMGYGAFANTMVGRAVFGIVGTRAGRVLDLSPKALSHGANVGKLHIEKVDDQTRFMRMREAYCFNEPFCIGLAEGALLACKREFVIAQRTLSLTSSDYFVQWR